MKPTTGELKRAGVLPTEAQVLRAICDYLDARKIFYLRLNSGVQVVAAPSGKRRAIRMCPAGTSDLLAFPLVRTVVTVAHLPALAPRPLWIEVKGPGGGMSRAQIHFLRIRAYEGHLVCEARCVADVERTLEGLR